MQHNSNKSENESVLHIHEYRIRHHINVDINFMAYIPVPKNSLSIWGTRPNLILRFLTVNAFLFQAAFRFGIQVYDYKLRIDEEVSKVGG